MIATSDSHAYWKKQLPDKALFPEIEWSKPEQKARAGKLAVIGGSKTGFMGVSEAYRTAQAVGVGQVKLLLPSSLKKVVPINSSDVVFSEINSSGSLSLTAESDMGAIANWADGILFIGDAGKNSETAILYERFVQANNKPMTITRDAVDLVVDSSPTIAERDNTVLVMSFAQLQKLFRSVYYPKILTFNMQLAYLVEALHKFTITHPVCLATFHNENILVAHEGEVVSQPWQDTMQIWRGITAAKAASYWLWSPDKPLESVATSFSA